MRRKTTTRKPAPANWYNTSEGPLNLFTGNIEDLITRLHKCNKIEIAKNLKFANEPDQATAHERLLKGDAATFKRYTDTAKNIKIEGYNAKAYILQEEGLFYDVSAFLTGQPEHWINEIDTPAPGKPTDIKINIFHPYWVEEKDIFIKLTKIVELIDATEAAGQRLSIKAVIFCHRKDEFKRPYTVEIEIKKESEPINLQQLVYLIASPILFRYGALSLQHNTQVEYNPQSNIEEEAKMMQQNEFIYIPSTSYDFQNDICYPNYRTFDYSKLDIQKQYNIKL